MANIFDVAKYIIDEKPNITTMKLEKLCYYCQAWTLAWDGEPLFDEEFEAWANGPVSPKLYSRHRGMFRISRGHFDDFTTDEGLTEDELENVKIVLSSYGDKDPQYLSELTHKERPWKVARNGLPLGESSDAVIDKEIIQDYYAGLLSNG